jgi:hypothetical protein
MLRLFSVLKLIAPLKVPSEGEFPFAKEAVAYSAQLPSF